MSIEKIAIADQEAITLIKKEKFKTKTILMRFLIKTTAENVASLNLLAALLANSSANYQDEKLAQALGLLYGASLDVSFVKLGALSGLNVSISYIDERYLEETAIDAEAIAFLHEVIFNPYLDKNKLRFNQKHFQIVKNNYIAELKSEDKSIYIKRQALKLLNHPTASIHSFGDLALVKKIENDKLYQLYMQLIKQTPYIYVLGNFEKENIISLIEKKFSFEFDIVKFIEPPPIEQTPVPPVIEEKQFTQSQLVVIYTHDIDVISDVFNEAVSLLFNSLLGGSASSLLFQNLREKAALCYTIRSSILYAPSVIFVNTGIAKENIDKALKMIDENVNLIAAGKIAEDLFLLNKKTTLSFLKTIDDNPGKILSFCSVLGKQYQVEDYIKALQKVTLEDVVNFGKTVKKKSYYLLKGVK